MAKDTQRGKKGKERPAARKTQDHPEPQLVEASRSRVERGRDYARSVFAKGAHDTLAAFVKGGLIALAAAIASWVGYHYYGHRIDLRAWLHGKPILETGSISKEPAKASTDAEARKREIDCNVAKAREVDRATERRKAAWGVYENCKTDFRPGWGDKRTAEEACGHHLPLYRQLRQEVLDKEAKDCSAAATPK